MWELLSGERADVFTNRLKKEVGPGHGLYEKLDGLIARAAAKSDDDILVLDTVESDQAYIVHLVWGQTTPNPFPKFPSWEAIPLEEAQDILRDQLPV